MDLIKIGKFITERRKARGYTQASLAAQLNITNRAVSKWENGLSLPDASLMLDLCQRLDITVNDLLSGEVVTMENQTQNNEQLLLDMAKELERKNKTIWHAMWAIMIVCTIGFIGAVFAAWYFIQEGPWLLVAIIGACMLFLVTCFYALKLEVSVGAYKCKNCGHEIVPTYAQALNAMHFGTTRYLKCPACQKRTWCKKVINKE